MHSSSGSFQDLPVWWLHRYWWRMLATHCVGDKFEMLVTDSGCRQHNDSAINIWNQSPSWSHQHNDVTNITVTHLIYCVYYQKCSYWNLLKLSKIMMHWIYVLLMLSCDGFQASEFSFALGICSRDSAFTVRYSQTVVIGICLPKVLKIHNLWTIRGYGP